MEELQVEEIPTWWYPKPATVLRPPRRKVGGWKAQTSSNGTVAPAQGRFRDKSRYLITGLVFTVPAGPWVRGAPFTMSAHPDDFTDVFTDGNDVLGDIVAYCSRSDPAMADTLREFTLIALEAMGAYPEDVTPRLGCSGGYHLSVGLAKGGKVSACPVSGDRHVRVELSPEECGAVRFERFLDLLGIIYGRGGRVIHLGLCIDDFGRHISPRDLYSFFEQGLFVTHAHNPTIKKQFVTKLDRAVDSFILGQDEGKYRSNRSLKVEAVGKRSDGLPSFMRWALHLHGDAADNFASRLAASEDFSTEFRTELVSYLDIKESRDRRNPSRQPRLAAYRRLVGAIARVKAYARKPLRTLEDMRDWFKRSGVKVYSLLVKAGLLDPAEAVTMGMARWKPRDTALINQAWDMVPPEWDVEPLEWNIPPLPNMAPS